MIYYLFEKKTIIIKWYNEDKQNEWRRLYFFIYFFKQSF